MLSIPNDLADKNRVSMELLLPPVEIDNTDFHLPLSEDINHDIYE